MQLNAIEDIIEDIRLGKMVILMDDEDRENEGDILVAAEKVTPEIINFMINEGRGLLCQTITEETANRLHLPLMVKKNTEQFSTNFTVSIEAAEGVSTGISALDRATTIKIAASPDSTPVDLVSPGHIFPVVAKNGGVLVRAGHTEAGCDLAKLAGLSPSCAIIEILNTDGTMARRPDLELFSQKNDIKLGTIADLIKYRLRNETMIELVDKKPVETTHGDFDLYTFRNFIDNNIHYALVHGDVSKFHQNSVTVRVHSISHPQEVLNLKTDGWNVAESLEIISQSSCGGVLVAIEKNVDSDLIMKHLDVNSVVSNINNAEIGIGSQILKYLGIKEMDLISSSPKKYHALSGFGLKVNKYITKKPTNCLSCIA